MSRNPTSLVHLKQTDTHAFRDWFGDSKVVDGEGRPLVVYHGTCADFYAFDAAADEDGAFFTSNKVGAAQYGPRLISAYLSLQNPKEFTAADWTSGGAMTRKEAEAAGCDGFIIRGHDVRTKWGKVEDCTGDTYIAFRSTQIKAAAGPWNCGAFDPENPDIRFSSTPSYRERAR